MYYLLSKLPNIIGIGGALAISGISIALVIWKNKHRVRVVEDPDEEGPVDTAEELEVCEPGYDRTSNCLQIAETLGFTLTTASATGLAGMCLYKVYQMQSEIGFKIDKDTCTLTTIPQFFLTYTAGILLGYAFKYVPNAFLRKKFDHFLKEGASVEIGMVFLTGLLSKMLFGPCGLKEISRFMTLRYGIMGYEVLHGIISRYRRNIVQNDQVVLSRSMRQEHPLILPEFDWYKYPVRAAPCIAVPAGALAIISTLGYLSPVSPIQKTGLAMLVNDIPELILSVALGRYIYKFLSDRLDDQTFTVVNELTSYFGFFMLLPGLGYLNFVSIALGGTFLGYIYTYRSHINNVAKHRLDEQACAIRDMALMLDTDANDNVKQLAEKYKDDNLKYLDGTGTYGICNRLRSSYYKIFGILTALSSIDIAVHGIAFLFSDFTDSYGLRRNIHMTLSDLEIIVASYGFLALERNYRRAQYKNEEISNNIITVTLRNLFLNPVNCAGITLYVTNLRRYIIQAFSIDRSMDIQSIAYLFVANMGFAGAFMKNLIGRPKYYMPPYLPEGQMSKIREIAYSTGSSPSSTPVELALTPGEAAYINNIASAQLGFWKKKRTYDSLNAAVRKHIKVAIPSADNLIFGDDTNAQGICEMLNEQEIRYQICIIHGENQRIFTTKGDNKLRNGYLTLYLQQESDGRFSIIHNGAKTVKIAATQTSSDDSLQMFDLLCSRRCLFGIVYAPTVFDTFNYKQYIEKLNNL